MNYIGNTKGWNFLGAKPTSDEFCRKFGRKLWFLKFFYMLSGTFAWQVLSYWLIWKLPNFATEHENIFFCQTTDKNSEKNKLLLADKYPTN